jgi:signal transduction histidine kinase
LTAGLSHELNNPLGALKSSLDSLWRLAQSGRSLPEDERRRIDSVQSDLRATLDASLTRMQEVIARIQRFANMDRAEMRCVDLNELLGDVIALLQATETGIALELVPGARVALSCHPQPLSGALSTLVAYSVEACRETGGNRVSIETVERGGFVEVRIARVGGAPSTDELERLLEPSFEVAGGRVAARTWSLFSARQIVQAQGGEVRAFSETDGGETGFIVTLPVPRE